MVNQTFTTLGAAETFFTDHAFDLGSLASGPLSASTLSLTASLTVTTDTPGSGFYLQLIIGDPPPAASHSSRFAQAMAGMGAGVEGSASPPLAGVSPTQSLLAISRMAAIA